MTINSPVNRTDGTVLAHFKADHTHAVIRGHRSSAQAQCESFEERNDLVPARSVREGAMYQNNVFACEVWVGRGLRSGSG
jgi:hypothetical protein